MLFNKCQFNKCPFNSTDNSRAYFRGAFVLTDTISVAEPGTFPERTFALRFGDSSVLVDDRTGTYVPGGGGGGGITITRDRIDSLSPSDAGAFKREHKLRAEAITLADDRVKRLGLMRFDVLAVDDNRIKRLAIVRSDVLSASELITALRTGSSVRVVTDALVTSDTGRQASWFVDTLGAITVSDAFSRASNIALRMLTDELAAYDDNTKRRFVVVSDSLATVDDFVKALVLGGNLIVRTLTDALTAFDADVRRDFDATLGESVAPSDGFTAATGGMRRTLTDALTASDTGRQASWFIDTLASLSLMDALVRLTNVMARTATDAVEVFGDDVERTRRLLATDEISATDATIKVIGTAARTIIVTEVLITSDVGRDFLANVRMTDQPLVTDAVTATKISATGVITKLLTELINVDDPDGSFSLAAIIDDALAVTDASTRTFDRNRALTDLVTMTDAHVKFFRRTRQLADALTVVDQFIKSTLGTQFRVLTDAAQINDFVLRYVRYTRALLDTVTVDDANSGSYEQRVTLEDSLVLADAYIKSLVGGGVINERTVTDDVVMIDALRTFRRLTRSMADVISVLDSVTAGTSGIRRITTTDTLTALDETVLSRLRTRLATETVTLTDGQFRAVLRMRDVVDSVAVEDGHVKFFLRTREILDTLGISDSLASSIVRFAGSIISVRIQVGVSSGAKTGISPSIALVGVQDSDTIVGAL